MDEQIRMTEKEALTAIVFGDTFALYDEKAFDEFVAPFERRFEANGIGREVFRGKRCLDAGCGGGRGAWERGQAKHWNGRCVSSAALLHENREARAGPARLFF